MSISEKRKLYLRLDQLLRMKTPGNSSEMAERLEVSRSTFFRCLDEMRMMGAPIEFDEHAHRYTYIEEGRFKFGFISREETVNFNGGLYQNSISFCKYFASFIF